MTNAYYVPDRPTLPLFNAFTVDLDLSRKSAVLWILQMIISQSHGGSREGYLNIRK
jgi:hypothetical protein